MIQLIIIQKVYQSFKLKGIKAKYRSQKQHRTRLKMIRDEGRDLAVTTAKMDFWGCWGLEQKHWPCWIYESCWRQLKST